MDRKTYQSGIIGNCAFMAHVKKNTNISWLCWPTFDSSFVFGKLLDDKQGGEFSISPVKSDYTSKQYYIEITNVLRKEITTDDGSYRVTDFTPRFSQYDRYIKPLMLIRNIQPLVTTPKNKLQSGPEYDYRPKKLK